MAISYRKKYRTPVKCIGIREFSFAENGYRICTFDVWHSFRGEGGLVQNKHPHRLTPILAGALGGPVTTEARLSPTHFFSRAWPESSAIAEWA